MNFTKFFHLLRRLISCLRPPCRATWIKVSFFVAVVLPFRPFFATNVLAQSSDDFFTEHQRYLALYRLSPSDVTLDLQMERSRDSKDDEIAFDSATYRLAAEFIHPQSDTFFWRAGFSYQLSSYDFSFERGLEFGERDFDTDLHKGLIRLGAGKFITDSILLTGYTDVGLFTDFGDNVNEDSFDATGQAELVFEMNPTAQLLVGLRYGHDLEGRRLIPLLGLRVLSSDGALKLAAMLPLEVGLYYRSTSIWDAYALASMSGDEYELAEAPGDQRGKLQIFQRRVATGFGVTAFDRLRLVLQAGIALRDRIDFDLDATISSGRDIEPGPFVGIGLGFAL